MSTFRSDYEAVMARRRRSERLWRLAGCAIVGASAAIIVLLGYFALIGFMVLAEGLS